jgi:hypothetical protein
MSNVAVEPSGNALMGSGLMPQLFLGVLMCFVLYALMFAAEALYKMYRRLGTSRIELASLTYASPKTRTISQDPSNPNSKTIFISDNELTGIEFSYSYFLNVNSSSFGTGEGLRHIFHKGNANIYPMMGPGVFMKNEINTLRVYMNSYATWNNYVDIPNVPIGKYFHIAMVCQRNGMEIYLNGNIIKKLNFPNSAPYQNYGDLCIFSPNGISLNHTSVPSTDENGLNIMKQNPMSGMLSRLYYFNYALSYTDIQRLMNEGPNPQMDSDADLSTPPYLTDNWWVNQ